MRFQPVPQSRGSEAPRIDSIPKAKELRRIAKKAIKVRNLVAHQKNNVKYYERDLEVLMQLASLLKPDLVKQLQSLVTDSSPETEAKSSAAASSVTATTAAATA